MSFWTVPMPGFMRHKASGLNVSDVFKTTLYTGNGSTQTITNGLDMVGKGGLIWTKSRSSGSWDHVLTDTFNGGDYWIRSNSSAARTNSAGIREFKSNGFETRLNVTNENGTTFVGWSFCRAPKFFDVVTYTGNGTSGRQIAHGLGVAPGFITTKSLSANGDWNSYHRSATGDLVLNSTAAQAGSRSIITAADTSTFTVSSAANTNGVTYVAYLFAHDPTPEGIIQCGSYTTNPFGDATVSLGWAPQYVLIKPNATADWNVLDTTRGWGSTDNVLVPNTAAAENSSSRGFPNSTGFNVESGGAGITYVYMTIRAEGV